MININMNENSLWDVEYLIDFQLHTALLSGCLPKNFIQFNKYKPVSLNKSGVYLVMLRSLKIKDDDPALVYNYIFYSDLFTNLLLLYLITRHKFIYSEVYKEWGDFHTFIDINIGNGIYEEWSNFQNYTSMNINLGFNNKFISDIKASPNRYNEYLKSYHHTKNISSCLDFVNISKKYVTVITSSLMSHLVYLLYNKKFWEVIYFVFKFAEIKENIFFTDKTEINFDKDIHLLNNCLFVVKDIKVFIDKIRDYTNATISEGPSRLRGQVNSMNNFLNCLDKDFRNCLYEHNRYHLKRKNVSSKYFLPKSCFSFQNVHMNLGNIRW